MTCEFFNVKSYGAQGDGSSDDSQAIQQAIAACSEAGGGTVFFPAGKYCTGSIELKSHITLHVDAGAVILGSEDHEQFPMTGPERIPGLGQRRTSLIAAFEADNIAIVGQGTIDGQGWHWWHKGKPRPRLLEFVLCSRVRIAGVTLLNSPSWTVHPLCCDNVVVDGITIVNPPDSPNTDGVNPEACSNVRISNCHINVGDDCVTIKSGREEQELERSRPCENITVTNCTMLHGHGGVVVGSEMSGGVRNVTISNCVFKDTDRGIRLKTRRRRGGTFEDVRVTNIIMDEVLCPFVINLYYRCGASPDDSFLFSEDAQPLRDDTPVARNIYFSNITARKARAAAGFFCGLPERPIQGVCFENVVIETTMDPEEKGGEPAMIYGLASMAGSGFLCKNVADIDFSNVQIETRQGPALTIENGRDITIRDLKCKQPHRQTPVIELKQTEDVVVRDCMARRGTDVFLQVAGEKTAGIAAIGNQFSRADQPIMIGAEVASGAVEKTDRFYSG